MQNEEQKTDSTRQLQNDGTVKQRQAESYQELQTSLPRKERAHTLLLTLFLFPHCVHNIYIIIPHQIVHHVIYFTPTRLAKCTWKISLILCSLFWVSCRDCFSWKSQDFLFQQWIRIFTSTQIAASQVLRNWLMIIMYYLNLYCNRWRTLLTWLWIIFFSNIFSHLWATSWIQLYSLSILKFLSDMSPEFLRRGYRCVNANVWVRASRVSVDFLHQAA